MNAKLSKVNQSIEKTIQIVEVMARGKGPMRLQDVAKKCGMPASTVMRMLNTLQVYGYVNQDPCTQHYSLSLRFARLGCLVSEQTNMRDVARPFLAELAQRCQETVCLWCEAEMEVECTDVVGRPGRNPDGEPAGRRNAPRSTPPVRESSCCSITVTRS